MIKNSELIADTNIFLSVVLGEPEKKRIIEITSNYHIISPEILPYEIGNALSAMVKRRQIAKEEVPEILMAVKMIPFKLVPVDIQQSLEIATLFNLYAYDAYFIQCANSMNLPILTLDKRMKQVARELGIKILE